MLRLRRVTTSHANYSTVYRRQRYKGTNAQGPPPPPTPPLEQLSTKTNQPRRQSPGIKTARGGNPRARRTRARSWASRWARLVWTVTWKLSPGSVTNPEPWTPRPDKPWPLAHSTSVQVLNPQTLTGSFNSSELSHKTPKNDQTRSKRAAILSGSWLVAFPHRLLRKRSFAVKILWV